MKPSRPRQAVEAAKAKKRVRHADARRIKREPAASKRVKQQSDTAADPAAGLVPIEHESTSNTDKDKAEDPLKAAILSSERVEPDKRVS